jgi:hypothetical protein
MFQSQKQQDDFFRQVAAEIKQPCDLYVYGGTAMICLGLPNRQTRDVDLYTTGQVELQAAVEQIADRFETKVDDFDPNEFVYLPPNLLDPPQLYKRFDRLSVYIVDPHRIAIDKLDRGARNDILDVKWLLKTNRIKPARISVCIEAARDVEDRQAMRERFAELAGLPATPSVSTSRTTSHRLGSSPRRFGLVIVLVLIVLLLAGILVIGSR